MITRNKEAVLSEKDLSCHLGQTCLVGYSEPMDPASYSSFEEFMAAVQIEWDRMWKWVYSAKLSGMPVCWLKCLEKQKSTQAYAKSFFAT